MATARSTSSTPLPHAGAHDPDPALGQGAAATPARPARERMGRPRLKVLEVVEATFAGVGRHVVDLCAGLLARGHEVHLAYSSLRMDQRFANAISKLGDLQLCPVSIARAPAPSDLRAILILRRYLRARGPFDIVHGHSSKGGAIARLAAGGLPCARIYTPNALRTLDPQLRRGERLLYEAAESFLGRHLTDALVAVAEEEADEAARLKIPAAKVHVVPNGIALPDLPERTALRAKYGLAEPDICVMWVGRLAGQKDPERFLRLFAALARELPALRAIMIGSGPLEAQVRARIVELGCGARIRLLRDDEAVLSMPAADVFVSTSRYEGLPYVVLEAQSVGLPVVGFGTGGLSTALDPGTTGFIVDQADEAGFKAALRRLAGDPHQRRVMGRAAAGRAVRFRLDDMIDRIEALYGTTARQASGRKEGLMRRRM
jgi:glycosyltransferase involved in cell wall biosynthesis